MQQAIRRNQSQPRDLLLLQQTEEVCQRADSAVKAIGAIRHDLLTQKLNSPQAQAEAGERASREVMDYLFYVKQITSAPTHPGIRFETGHREELKNLILPVDGKMAALQSLLVEKGQERWQLGRSLAEKLATLTQQVATIREFERLALQHQNQKIGCGGNIIYDAVGAFAAAESNTVAVGDKYEAELFLTTVYDLPVLGMTVNGQPIDVGPDNHGLVELTVPPAAEADKTPSGKAYWTGRIRALVKGRDSTFTVKVPYTVRAN